MYPEGWILIINCGLELWDSTLNYTWVCFSTLSTCMIDHRLTGWGFFGTKHIVVDYFWFFSVTYVARSSVFPKSTLGYFSSFRCVPQALALPIRLVPGRRETYLTGAYRRLSINVHMFYILPTHLDSRSILFPTTVILHTSEKFRLPIQKNSMGCRYGALPSVKLLVVFLDPTWILCTRCFTWAWASSPSWFLRCFQVIFRHQLRKSSIKYPLVLHKRKSKNRGFVRSQESNFQSTPNLQLYSHMPRLSKNFHGATYGLLHPLVWIRIQETTVFISDTPVSVVLNVLCDVDSDRTHGNRTNSVDLVDMFTIPRASPCGDMSWCGSVHRSRHTECDSDSNSCKGDSLSEKQAQMNQCEIPFRSLDTNGKKHLQQVG